MSIKEEKSYQIKGLCHIQCHFHEENVIFRQHTFDRVDHKYPSNYFDVVRIFVAFLSPNFYQFGKLQTLLGTMAKVPYKHCKRIQCKKPRVGLKRFVCKICLMNHTMHNIDDEWIIFMLDLNHHS